MKYITNSNVLLVPTQIYKERTLLMLSITVSIIADTNSYLLVIVTIAEPGGDKVNPLYWTVYRDQILLVCNCGWDHEHGLYVSVYPEVKAGSSGEFLYVLFPYGARSSVGKYAVILNLKQKYNI